MEFRKAYRKKRGHVPEGHVPLPASRKSGDTNGDTYRFQRNGDTNGDTYRFQRNGDTNGDTYRFQRNGDTYRKYMSP